MPIRAALVTEGSMGSFNFRAKEPAQVKCNVENAWFKRMAQSGIS